MRVLVDCEAPEVGKVAVAPCARVRFLLAHLGVSVQVNFCLVTFAAGGALEGP